jgi:hypothetical protein
MRPSPATITATLAFLFSQVVSTTSCSSGCNLPSEGDSSAIPADSAAPLDSGPPEDTGPPSAFTGQVEIRTGLGQGGPYREVCNLTVDLLGEPSTEPCEGCSHDLAMRAEVVEDHGLDVCQPSPMLSWLPSGAYGDLRLAWAETATLETWGEVSEALLTGFTLQDAGYGPEGPSWQAVAYDGHAYGSATLHGSRLSWSYEEQVNLVAPRAYNACSFVHRSLAAVALAGEHSGSSTLNCEAEEMDVWSFEASGRVDLTVDTTSTDGAADLLLLVNDASTECTLAVADDNHACSHAPAAGSCPSMSFQPGSAGPFHAVVMNKGSCAGSRAQYELRLDAEDDPQLTLVQDDFPVLIVDLDLLVLAEGEGTFLEGE